MEIKLTKEECRKLLNVLARTSAKGDDLTFSMELGDKLYKHLYPWKKTEHTRLHKDVQERLFQYVDEEGLVHEKWCLD